MAYETCFSPGVQLLTSGDVLLCDPNPVAARGGTRARNLCRYRIHDGSWLHWHILPACAIYRTGLADMASRASVCTDDQGPTARSSERPASSRGWISWTATPGRHGPPTITVRRVATLEEGIQLANASRYGLGSAVFARSRRRARAAARDLRSGMTAINSVIAFAMVPALPFGGVGESGFGRIHGADGLREFTRAKAITSQWMKPPMNLTSFGRTDADLRRTVGLIRLLHGRRGRS